MVPGPAFGTRPTPPGIGARRRGEPIRVTHDQLTAWSQRLLAASGLDDAWARGETFPDGPAGLVRSFRDEQGHRRAVDAPFLSAALGLALAPSPSHPDHPPDVRLWRRVHEPGLGLAGLGSVLGRDPLGPVLDGHLAEPIELWTERELSALHAFWRLSELRPDAAPPSRALAAARWHVEHLQPDNATNHPWAIHVFLILSSLDGSPEGLMHADAMLHACRAGTGAPDRFSAVILRDASRALSRWLGLPAS